MALINLNTDTSLTVDANSDGKADVLLCESPMGSPVFSIDGGQKISFASASDGGQIFLKEPISGGSLFPAVNNTSYYCSFEYKTSGDADAIMLGGVLDESHTEEQSVEEPLTSSAEWTEASTTLATSGDSAFVGFGCFASCSSSGSIWIRKLQVSYSADEPPQGRMAYDSDGLLLGSIAPISCVVTETLNGGFEVEILHPIDDTGKWERLQTSGIVEVETHRGFQKFRLYSVEHSPIENRVIAYGRHIFYDLLSNFIESARPIDKTGQEAGDVILGACQYAHGFTFASDITDLNTAYYIRANPVQALMGDNEQSFVNRWGGEIERDNYDIAINSRIGSDNGFKIAYRKNITGLIKRESIRSVVTRIYPYATGAGNTVYTLPEKYIDSDKINDYPHPVIAAVKFSDIQLGDDYADFAAIYAEMRSRVAEIFAGGVDQKSASFEVNIVDVSKTAEYADLASASIGLGDDVTVQYDPLDIDLSLRVVRIVWDSLANRVTGIVVGDKVPDLSSHTVSIDSDIWMLKNSLTREWFDEQSENIIPCYESAVYSGASTRNIVMTQEGTVMGRRGIAIGQVATNNGNDTIVIGNTAESEADDAVAIGHKAKSENYGVAVGYEAEAALHSVSILSKAGGGDMNTLIGWMVAQPTVSDYSTLVGSSLMSYDDYNILIGSQSAIGLPTDHVSRSILIGSQAYIKKGPNNVVIGDQANVNSDGSSGASTVIGAEASGRGDGNTVVGYRAKTGLMGGSGGVVIGAGATANSLHDEILIGQSGLSAGDYDILIGSAITLNGGEFNIILSSKGVKFNGDNNIIIGGGTHELARNVSNLIEIGYGQYVDIAGTSTLLPPIISGQGNTGLLFHAVKADTPPVKLKLLPTQTGYAFPVYGYDDTLIGGFEVDGGSVKVRDGNTEESKKLWFGTDLPATTSADTVYVKTLDDSDIWGAM